MYNPFLKQYYFWQEYQKILWCMYFKEGTSSNTHINWRDGADIQFTFTSRTSVFNYYLNKITLRKYNSAILGLSILSQFKN